MVRIKYTPSGETVVSPPLCTFTHLCDYLSHLWSVIDLSLRSWKHQMFSVMANNHQHDEKKNEDYRECGDEQSREFAFAVSPRVPMYPLIIK